MGAHRVLSPQVAAGRIILVKGPEIVRMRATPGVQEVAYVDHRTRRQQSAYARLHDHIADELRQARLGSLVPDLDQNLWGVALAPRLSKVMFPQVLRMMNASNDLPTAVFVAPPSLPPGLPG